MSMFAEKGHGKGWFIPLLWLNHEWEAEEGRGGDWGRIERVACATEMHPVYSRDN